jgi:uncharacterized membrane protein YphA (DoxX/SURF4 family)
MNVRDVPLRLSTGAYILHAGIEKWRPDPERAKALHGLTASAFPIANSIPAETFVKCLAAAEIVVGSALLVPIVPNVVAGALLTGFAGGLMALYFRTPSMRRPGSIWPSQAGTGVSKDVWMFGIGLGLMGDSVRGRCCN